jgi:O-antigen/teichoic acid export membrane protein
MSVPVAADGARRVRVYGKALISNYALTAVNLGTYLVCVPWYLDRLGTESFGFWLILLQLLSVLSLVTTWIATPLTREAAACHVAGDPAAIGRVFRTATAYYAVCGCLIVLAGAPIAFVLPTMVRLTPALHAEASIALLLVAISFAASIQFNLLLSVLIGYQRMHVANVLLSLFTVSSAGFGVVLVYAGAGLIGLAAGQLASSVSLYVVAFLLVQRYVRLPVRRAAFDAVLLRRLVGTGTGYLTYSLSYLALQSDTILIGVMLGAPAAAVYGVASRAVDQAVQLIWKVPDSLLPITAEFAVRGELNLFRRTHRMSSKITMAAALFGAITLVFFGRTLLQLWVGAENAAAAPVLAALAAVLVMQAFVHSSVVIPYAANRMGRIPLIAAAEAVLKIGLALVLLPQVGPVGAALGTVIAQLAFTGWYVPRAACRLTGDSLTSYFRDLAVAAAPPCAVLVLCFSVAVAMIPGAVAQMLIGVPTGLGIFVILYSLFGLGTDERKWIASAVQRAGAFAPAAPAVVRTPGM